ncbi:2-oxo acid dehydrogenase subunit E2 [Rhodococcus sp. ABRD24]|uniref:dihydrolipoamide acetyltransferase family protein n=1 Tax=Rhodococcus sp. ABRD24 TaxID=2507582 RepID=UPI00103C86A2|nr:dihydrolipoamide acetyltransferase family protein [Rhodococcus sp. ABRD24]QBJ96925.1 2-oxo acid dehydrogenase subunit E2 [Rhodococcus sp. ABRD24]
MIDFTLPSLGADMDEGRLDEWLVAPGDAVERGQVVAVVETAKAAVEVECWQEGTVHQLLVPVGETVPVGQVIATLLEPGEEPPAVTPGPRTPPSSEGRRRITPAARQAAADRGIDLGAIAGTGPDGAVTLDDVRGATPAPAAVGAVEPAPSGGEREPGGVDRSTETRRAIAAAMSRSKREIPHYYLTQPVPLEATLEWLNRENASRPVTERLLPVVLQLKAVALAAHEYPDMNGFWSDGCFQAAESVHVGVAIALRQGGLVAPALHDVASKSLQQIGSDLSDLVRRVRVGSMRSSEMSDPTLTVTSLGDEGVESVLGVIYPPQVALVGFGKPMERAWVDDGRVRAVPTLVASLAADHRVSDGRRGALFLAAIADLLQHPERL